MFLTIISNSAFGSLDGINAAVRTNGQVFGLADAHIRFERASEVDQKSGDQIEDLLHDSFEEFDINRLPNSLVELKAGPPSAWTELIRQIVIRSISFSEYEMLSHPVVILSVIATSDVDHIACMQELVSGHHSPAGIKNGLYDPTVLRQYIVLEDVAESSGNGLAILHQLQSVFPPNSTKLIRLNSFPANAPHLDQPDMWSKFLFPKFFPQRVPSDKPNLPRNPTTNNVVYGGRLTVEDFMNLRNFCINLFNQEIVPCLERRLNFLNKTVSDTRKGMKNVLNRFWRKPKEEYETKTGGVRYKYDKIESQILLLADTSFIIRDYQTALSTYKLVRDDFKSDKSLMHLAHVTIMIALCTLLMDATKAKDLPSLLEDLQNILCPTLDQPHGNAYFAVMAAEMYFYHYPHRLPLEAAKILLQASANIVRYPLLSGLLMEKAASCFLNAGHTRRFVFHEVLAGNRIHKFGARPAKHAAVCFAVSMLFLDQGHWGDLKTKMSHSLALDMKNSNKDLAQRSLLLMLRILTSILDDNAEVGNRTTSIRDALSVYNDLIAENIWGSVVVRDEWFNMTTRDLLLNSLPISPYDNTISGDILSTSTIIHGLPIPYVDQSTVSLLRPVNGLAKYEEAVVPSEDLATADQMVTMLELEANWLSSQKGNVHKTSEPNTRLSDVWADTMAELKKKDRKSAVKEKFYLALGEHINLSFTMQNKLPVDITAKQCRLHFSDTDSFEILPKDLIIPQNSKNKIQLAALPKKMGQFRVESTFWNLSEHLTVCCKLQRTGELLQKTIRQRANRERVVDRSLHFEVLQPHPLLTLSFEGLSPEVLQGQLLRTTLSLRNDGFARACNISIKLSQPSLILYCNSSEAVAQGQPMGIIPFTGSSSTVIQLNENLVIHPGSQIQLEAWLRITKSGDQKISLLASYMAQGEDGRQDCFFPDGSKRTSFISITVILFEPILYLILPHNYARRVDYLRLVWDCV